MNSKLLIIDGHAIMHRAFHAIPPLSTPSGEPVNAVHGTIGMLLKIIQELKPTGIVFAFDEKAPTFRNKALPAYQAQRPAMAHELDTQFNKIKQFLDAAGIPYYSKPGYEADDVIGTLATIATQFSVVSSRLSETSSPVTSLSVTEKQKTEKLDSENRQQKTENWDEVVIVTSDRDQLQLVDDKLNIKLYMPIAGLANGKLFGEAETVERMGVMPNQIPDLKALIGDPSDNYKGVAGIGPKTASNLLSKYKSKSKIYENLDEIKESVRQKLITGKDSADQSFMLATIVRDVPIEFDFEKMNKWKLDSPDVIKLFTEEFGFKTITERIKKYGKELEEEKQGSLF